MQKLHSRRLAVVAALASAMGASQLASATPFTPGVTIEPCFGGPPAGCGLPGPDPIPGKEYSNNPDVDDTQPLPGADPEQNLAWDGIGGREDAFDYSGSRVANYNDAQDRQVDALANNGDVLFDDTLNDLSWLVFSVTEPTPDDREIFFERPIVGGGGVWATGPEVDLDADPLDVDGLELWGQEGGVGADANRYSVQGDPVLDAASGSRVAVFDYDPGSNTASTAFTIAELAAGIAALTGADAAELEDTMNLDAMMSQDQEILFSISALTLASGPAFDGGEIFHFDRTAGTTSYLSHGGHLWDTSFDIMGTFGTNSEDIDALEAVAVPLPASLGLMALGLAALGLRRRL